jgi:outer membrane receptor for ferrienterochelin and colicins
MFLALPVIGLRTGAAAAAAEEPGTIMGKVTAKETGRPLHMASVIIDNRAVGAPADVNGTYVFDLARPGTHSVMASYIGYRPMTKEVTVAAGDTVIVDFSLEEDPIQGDVVVVTATRMPTYIKEVPVRTEVITREEIKDKGAVNLYEALEGVPGVRVESQCAFCNFTMVRLQGLGSDHCQMLIDGQPVYSGLASVYGLEQVPMENIEQIEIVKGAGSSLYGAKAVAGVVNVITRSPGNEPSLKLNSSIGAYGTNRYALTATTKAAKMDATVTAQKTTGDEIDENGNGFADRVRTDDVALSAKINVRNLWGDDRLRIGGRSVNEDRLGGEIAIFENPFAESTERIKTKRYEAGVSYERTLGAGDNLSADFNFVTHNRNATNDGFLGDYMDTHGGSVPPVDELSPYIADERLYVADFRYSRALSGSQRLLAGFQYSHNNLEEEGRYVIVDEDDAGYGESYTSRSKKHADDYGFYLQDQIDVGDGVDLVLGARYDVHRSEDGFGGSGSVAPADRIELEYEEESFNPRAAVRYEIGDLNVRGAVGTGFRVPYGFSEDLHLCSGSPRVNKPADLKPEKSVSYNLGFDYSRPAYDLSANVFRTDLRNKIDYTDAGEESKRLGYTYEWDNIGDAYTQGVELGATVLVFRDFTADLDFAYTDAQYDGEREDWATAHPEFAEDSKFISRVPRTSAGLKLNYTPGYLNLVLDFDYTGSMYIDYYQEEDIELPGSKIKHTDPFVTTDLKVSYQVKSWGLTPFAGAKNLFDYVQDEKRLDDAAYIWAPWVGRIVYGGVEIDF